MAIKVRAFVSAVVTGAVIGLVVLIAAGDPNALRSAEAALCFACLGIFAQFLTYNLDAKRLSTIVFIPFLATIFLAPTWVSLVAITGVALVGTIIKKRSTLKSVFNVAQWLLSAGVAVVTYRVFGGTPWLVRFEFNWFAYIAAYSVFLLINNILIRTVVSLEEAKKPKPTLFRLTSGSEVVYDILTLPLAYLFALVYVRFGPLGVMALGLPLLAARQLYKTNSQLERVNQELLELMVAAIEARDPYTSGHSRRVARNARIIARALGVASRDVDRVAIAALLHDVGKIYEAFAPLLRKPGKLSPEERTTMETHPIKSAELVQNVSHLSDVVSAIRSHHENWDGTGYPDGLRGEEIPLWSRIIMIADTVDAMTTDRPYRAAMGEAEVRAELLRLKGKQFDPVMCEKLLGSTLYPSLFERQTAKTPGEIHMLHRRSLGVRAVAGA
jgi:putative nucleotidyltransferase with HDIG domain